MFLEMILVIAITDGDTIKVLDKNNHQIKVRLASIDAPERKQPFGKKSKQMLANMIWNKRVNLDCPKKDRYQRLICTIIFYGVDINREMVATGGAWVYRKYYKGTDYLKVERYAKNHHLGLWNTSEYQAIPPWEWRGMDKRKK
ncbi:thermonuclease family protein [sulfur-oxidizing endosymbiont of Gigantopelta aegis]|uniref:thermonuclease family protein n=1 Tax=sulfur-oxidizing endosymbiont of Gigantopelta aegis TaxID=2794934 RepID=UPI0018DD16EA|nr:thermonuclease family protein [sulfur-oxidizing endosymbiont of Gigantopelta aegis]